MPPPTRPFLEKKKALRLQMEGERKVAAGARPDAAVHAARHFMANIRLPENSVVSLYYPMRDELATEPLLDALAEKGATTALPVIAEKNAPLAFRQFAPGDALVRSVFNTMTPLENAALLTPDIVVVPLLAFTRAGDRLGYGGGYYDRTLENRRRQGGVLAVGYAYSAQEVDAIPVSPLDQPLDWVVTEAAAIFCS